MKNQKLNWKMSSVDGKNVNKMLPSLPTYVPSKWHAYIFVLLSSTPLDTWLFVTEINNDNGITRVKETAFPVLLIMHIRKGNNSLSPVLDSCLLFIHLCFDLSSPPRGHWRERGCTAGYVTVSLFINACCFREDLLFGRSVPEKRNDSVYLPLFFTSRTVKLMLEIMHIALKQPQFSLTVPLGRLT